jgi:hypothetical protein
VGENVIIMITVCVIWPEGYDEDMLLFKVLCKEKGYTFQYFPSIASGYESINDNQPEVIVIKRFVHLQDDGIDFCKQIRQDESNSRISLIVGWADIRRDSFGTFEETYSAGANGCFGRVYDIVGVFKMIDSLLENPTLVGLADQYLKR